MAAEARPGGGHCGAMRFEAAVDLAQVTRRNCSICIKRGLRGKSPSGEDMAAITRAA